METNKDSNRLDKLLHDKMKDWEYPPGAEVWQRLEQKTSRRRVVWGGYWKVAACLLIAFLAGYGLWEKETPPATGLAKISHSTPEPGINPGPAQVVPDSPREQPQVAIAEQVPAKEKVQKIRTPELPLLAEAEHSGIATGAPETDGAVTTPGEDDLPAIAGQPQTVAPLAPPSLPPVTVALKSTVLVVHVEPAEAVEAEKPKRLQQIFRQLKKVKQGERVDWEEVGFNPRKVLAKVDYELTGQEGSFSKQYKNFKERTNF